MNKNVPIIILVWEGWIDTKCLLESLVKSKINAPIWLVDNGSKNIDPLIDIKRLYPQIEYYRFDKNYGFSGGINRALALARDKKYQFAYILNNDCLIENDFLTPIIALANKINKSSIIGSRYISKNINGEYSDWGFHSNPSEFNLYKQGFMETDRIVGCGMLIKIDCFFEVGGFDERFFCYGEENDLCYKFKKIGYIVGICFDSLIKHNHQGSDVNGNSVYYRTRNGYLLKSLHPDMDISISNPIDIIGYAYENITNYEIFSSYIEGLYCSRSCLYGERKISNNKMKIYLLFIYYFAIFFPHRIISFSKSFFIKNIQRHNNIYLLHYKMNKKC